MNVTIKGVIFSIAAEEQVTEKFKKKECVIRVPAKDPKWDDYIKVEFQQSGCDGISSFSVNDKVTVNAILKGRKWEKDGKTSIFNTVVGLSMAQDGAASPTKEIQPQNDFYKDAVADVKAKATQIPAVSEDDDLPF